MNLQTDDFTLFGVPQRFSQDNAVLDTRWKELQREAHPDRFAGKGDAAQRLAMQWSARINEARQRLIDPLRRAAYLCELNGVSVGAEDNTAMPPAFLMQQMAWREALDEAGSLEALEHLSEEVTRERRTALMTCAKAIDEAADFKEAAAQVRRLMFIERFARDVDSRLDAHQDTTQFADKKSSTS